MDKKWHVDKNIPISTIAMMLLQTMTFVWFAATLASRVDALEKHQAGSAWQAEKIIRIDEKLNSLQSGMNDLKQMVAPVSSQHRPMGG